MNAEPMTKQRIEKYKKLQEEIEMLEEKIREENFSGEYVSDIVHGSSKEFPYTPRSITIAGHGSRMLPRLCKRRDKQIAECEVIEKFVDEIEDSTTWQIFMYRYIEGKTLKNTAELVGYSESQTGRYIKDYFEKMTAHA